MFFDESQSIKESSIDTSNPAIDIHLAAAVLMFKVARADGGTCCMELAHVVTILRNQFALSTQEIEDLISTAQRAVDSDVELENLTQLLCTHLEAHERTQLLNGFWLIATADDAIKQGERSLIDKIARNLELEADDITRARYRAEQKLELNIA